MAKRLIREIKPYVKLYRYDASGIAIVENGSTGNGHSPHPNIDVTGSVKGMRSLRYWGKDDRVVRAGGYYYNTSVSIIEDEYDQIAADNCRCGGRHTKRQLKPSE